MAEVIETMLARYACHSYRDYENALKEIIQEISLLGLWRAKFFEKAAFYGGTALRILYGLNRFSEDLDFSLLEPDKNFQLNRYFAFLESELASFGFQVTITAKEKTSNTAIQSAFIKAGTREHFLEIKAPEYIAKKIHRQELLKIKIEIDVDPPLEFMTEVKPLLQPIPFMVHTYQLPDLFAGKCHALLCRQWGKRVKGRDWYDFVWYIGRGIPLRKKHLQKRLEQTNAWPEEKLIRALDIIELINKKIKTVDFSAAKSEVMPFLKDPDSVSVWSETFFKEILGSIRFI